MTSGLSTISCFHDVLDHEDRDAAAVDREDELHRLLDLGRVQARHDLVEKEELRVHREGLRELEALEIRDRERGGLAVALVGKGDALEDLVRVGAGLRGRPRAAAGAEHRPRRHVLAHRELAQGLDDLEGPGHPEAADPEARRLRDVPPVEDDRPGRRLVEARHAVHERRLARAVRAEHAEDLAAADREVHAVHGREAAELLRDSRRDEDRVVRDAGRRHGDRAHQVTRWARTFARRSDARKRRSPAARRRPITVMRPRGRKTMKNTMMRPSTVGWSSRNRPQT